MAFRAFILVPKSSMSDRAILPEISNNDVLIIQGSVHKRITEMVGFILGKLLPKCILNKLSQVIFSTVD